MSGFYSHFLTLSKSPGYYLPLFFSFLLNMLIWLVIFWRLPATANWITLHFNIYFGIDWIGSWIQIFIYPLISFIIIILNLVISWLIAGKSKSLALAVNYTSLLVQFIILTGLITLFIKYFV